MIKGGTTFYVEKIWILGVIHLLLFSLLSIPIVNAEEVNLTPNARSAILIDQDTGTILYEKIVMIGCHRQVLQKS